MSKLTLFSDKIKPLVASVFEGGGKLTVAEKLTLIINNMILSVNGVKPDENGNVQIQASGATVKVGTTSTLDPGNDATVTNSGSDTNVVLNFGIPKGDRGEKGDTGPQGETGATGPQGEPGPKGDTGEQGPAGADGKAATIKVGTVTTLPAGSNATVVNSGDENAAVFDFGIPQGQPGSGGGGSTITVNVGTTETLEPGSKATVTNSGTQENVILNFGIPAGTTGAQGEQGPKGDTGSQGPQGETGATGPQGDPGPKGDTGEQGPAGADGKAATITVGEVTTVEAGSPATVVNTGTENAAVLSFGIPKGEQGAQGAQGPKGDAGAQGPQGKTGPKGDTGEQGPAGANGKAATITVGNVTTLPAGSDATVVNSGNENAAVFDFGIPMGQSGSGEVFTLLWTNPSPTAQFANQGVQIDIENYDAFIILAKDGGTILNNYAGASGVLMGAFTYWGQTAYNMSVRAVTLNNNTINFGECKIIDGGPLNTGTFNHHCIPYKIYGMKLE